MVVLHGFAHAKIPVPISQLQSLFIVSVIVLAPLLAMVLLWMQFRRAGGLLLFLAMAGALVFGAYNHFIVVGADHISHVPPGEWGMLFRVTAYPLGTRRRIREWSGRMGVEPYAAGKENFMNHLEAFKQHRPLLFSIAYRMLGSVTDAEDLIQETFLRWQQASKTEVRSPKAYLSRIITRLCIDYLRSARLQREQYVGSWLPEPIIT